MTAFEPSLEILYLTHRPFALKIITRLVHNRAAAEDLLQDTFLRIWKGFPSFNESRGSLRTWIAAVARNLAIDYLRSLPFRVAARSVELTSLERSAPMVALRQKAFDLDHGRLIRKLSDAITRLKPVYKEIIHLAFFEGLSHREIAGRLQRPLGTIKSWLRTTLRDLRLTLLATC